MDNILNIFNELNKSGIKYCQFKSTQHLDKSFEGKTDFDLLVHPDDIYELRSFLINAGCKQRLNTYDKQYMGMEDFLFYDKENDAMHHFHLHYSLLFGENFRKNYAFPIGDWLWGNTKMSDNYPLKVFNEELELILLIQRIILKTRFNIRLFLYCLKRRKPLPVNMYDELNYLIPRVEFSRFNQLIEEHFPDLRTIIDSFLSTYRNEELSFSWIFLRKRKLKKALSKNMRLALPLLKQQVKIRKFSKKISRSFLPTGGKIVAFIGADGSGKSSNAKKLSKWLSYKLSTKELYLGIPKDNLLNKFLMKSGAGVRKYVSKNHGQRIIDYVHVRIARIRAQTLKKARYYSNAGFVVILDRYPLKEFYNMGEPMDGPRLKNESLFHLQEKNLYDSCPLYPDIGIVLDVDLETSVARKKEHQVDGFSGKLEKKIKAIKKLDTGLMHSKMFKLDANKDADEVSLELRVLIWGML